MSGILNEVECTVGIQIGKAFLIINLCLWAHSPIDFCLEALVRVVLFCLCVHMCVFVWFNFVPSFESYALWHLKTCFILKLAFCIILITFALEKEMATHSSILTWRIPETEEPSGLPSWSCTVGYDWSDLAAAAAAITFYPL